MKILKGNFFFCKTLRLNNYLVERGCKFIKAIPDKTNPAFKVFMFLIDKTLINALEEKRLGKERNKTID